jgi:hypothetical protein
MRCALSRTALNIGARLLGFALMTPKGENGSVERIHNPIDVVELAREKAVATVLMPVACRRSLVDLSDEVAARAQVVFHVDAADALRKALYEG